MTLVLAGRLFVPQGNTLIRVPGRGTSSSVDKSLHGLHPAQGDFLGPGFLIQLFGDVGILFGYATRTDPMGELHV
jgi:hypothetical protein